MTTQIAKDDMSFAGAAVRDHGTPGSPAALPGMLFRLTQWVSRTSRRRGVLAELNALSEHELADIGLTHGDLPRVFDADFVADRSLPRA